MLALSSICCLLAAPLFAAPQATEPPQLLLDLNSGSLGSLPSDLVRLGDEFLFRANSQGLGQELWATDGTATGTRLVGDLRPGFNGSFPIPQLALGGRVLLTAETPGIGREPWVSDGTPAGTELLADLRPGLDGSGSSRFVRLGAHALFVASAPAAGRALYRTDATSSGTVQVTFDTGLDFPQTGLLDSASLNGLLVFQAVDSAAGAEPWVTDGTTAGTFRLTDLAPGAEASDPQDFVRLGDRIYFTAFEPGVGRELFSTDGTAAGTQLVRDIAPGPDSSSPWELTAVEDLLVFSALTDTGREPWTSDGTTPGTGLLVDLAAFPSSASSVPTGFKGIGGAILFSARTTEGGPYNGFWVSDGTAAGTQNVALEISGPTEDNRPFDFGTIGGSDQVLFRAFSDTTGNELWFWDGTSPTASLLPEVNPGKGPSTTGPRSELGGRLFFVANDPLLGFEAFSYDVAEFGTFGAEPFGYGCATGEAPKVGFDGSALLGQSLDLLLSGTAPGATTLAFYGGQLDLLPLNQACTLYFADPRLLSTTVADGSGRSSLPVTIPGNAALAGLDYAVQWVVPEPGGPLQGLFALSDALEIVPGS